MIQRSAALAACQSVLTKAYRSRLDIELKHSETDFSDIRRPHWCAVSQDDLTSARTAGSSDCVGLVLDPEIGVLAYIIPFDSGTVLRKQISRALTLQSQLSAERHYSKVQAPVAGDPGVWRIVLHWLVNTNDSNNWTDQIALIRRETAFSEELSMDALFLDNTSLQDQIERHSFPRLLLTARQVLRKNRLDEVSQWLSADKLVETALEDFVVGFHKPAQSEMAREVVNAMNAFGRESREKYIKDFPPDTPKSIHAIHVRNFRNLRDARFDLGTSSVSATIIHGPNGTGKSSLCEALSLSLFKSSFRFRNFADRTREKDITATDRAREYISKYLSPVNPPSPEPTISVDGSDFSNVQLVGIDKIEETDLAMNGTILTQDSSLEFARMPSHELGARVLRGYSELANYVEQVTDDRVAEVNARRQDFLRGLGLSAAITRPDTAFERIAKREIDLSLPPLPHTLVNWIESVESLPQRLSRGLALQWRAWGESGRSEVIKGIAESSHSPARMAEHTRRWLEKFNELVAISTELIKNVDTRSEILRSDVSSVIGGIETWGLWLEKTSTHRDFSASSDADAMVARLHESQRLQADVLEKGRSASSRLEHLIATEAFIRETWSKTHAEECPSCGTSHSGPLGVLAVVERLRSQTSDERDRLRTAFGDFKFQIEGIQKQLAELGQDECPVSPAEQSRLSEAVHWLIPQDALLPDWIANSSQRESIVRSATVLHQLPIVPSSVEVESSTSTVIGNILSRFQEAERIFEAPNDWKPVKDKLTRILADIVNQHLPRTLDRLWRELALNLTSAPWLLPDSFRIDVVTRRGEHASTIRVKDRLARYVLNQAEIHTLGLAWFFTRHLTRDRFFNSCIVMDDPAHELDQTSFRDLCRLWSTMMRLHRTYRRPWKLIVMLNQESRAVEAARATRAILSVLGWEREQDHSVQSISVVGDGFRAPQPDAMFSATKH